jgi:hypothetical protein
MLKSTHEEVVERARKDLMSLVERLHDTEDRHIQIEASLREQIQNLAEQLATIRVANPNATPDFDRFEPKPEPPKPYSAELKSFLDGIAYEDSRLLLEEDIEHYRQTGHDDEQILELISGSYNG